jgi:hypothetical protein
MDYINTATQEIVTLAEVRVRLNASIPDGVEADGYAPILPAEAPTAPEGSKVIAAASVEVAGQWFYGWAIVSLYATQAEADAARAAKRASDIEALLSAKGVTRQLSQLTILVLENEAKTMAPGYGMTAAQGLAYLYTRNKTYRECKDLETAILALEAAP